MTFQGIRRDEVRGRFVFHVDFDVDGRTEVVTVTAAQLLHYRQFQRAVLAQVGRVWAQNGSEWEGQRFWRRWIAERLAKAHDEAGQQVL